MNACCWVLIIGFALLLLLFLFLLWVNTPNKEENPEIEAKPPRG